MKDFAKGILRLCVAQCGMFTPSKVPHSFTVCIRQPRFTSLSHVDRGLLPSTVYSYEVRAFNDLSFSPSAPVVVHTLANTPRNVPLPTLVAVSPRSVRI